VWGGTGYRLKAGMTNGAVSGKWGRDAAWGVVRASWCGTWGREVWGGTGYRLKAGMTNGAVSGKWGRDAELDTGSRPV